MLTQAGGTVDFNDQFRRSPYFQKWSIDIQRDIGSTVAVSVGYLGSKGSNLAIGGTGDNTVNINQLDSQYLSMGTALEGFRIVNAEEIRSRTRSTSCRSRST